MVGLRFTTVQYHYSANKPYCITVLPRFSDTIFFQYAGTIVSLRNLIHHIRFTRITIFLNENLAATALFFFLPIYHFHFTILTPNSNFILALSSSPHVWRVNSTEPWQHPQIALHTTATVSCMRAVCQTLR